LGSIVAAQLSAYEEIRRRIRAKGRITFAEFMETALYWPLGGYYTSGNPTGARGDFYTSPGAHPAFGALLAMQAYQMWVLMGRPSGFHVLEQGAGDGLLCHDFMVYAAQMPDGFVESLQYLCIDRRSRPGAEAGLPHELTARVQRIAASELPVQDVEGIVLSNELLDATPVHRVTVSGGRLYEVYVTLRGDEPAEVLDSPSTTEMEARLERLGVKLTEGQTAEINLCLDKWLANVTSTLKRGYVITIDYGYQAKELYSLERKRGTLTTFYKHAQIDKPYIHIGQQDMTSHVDFTSLVDLGREFGLTPIALLSQGRFLANLGVRRMIAKLPSMGVDQGTRDANRMGILELARPDGLGDFKVIVQCKDAPKGPLWGVEGGEEAVKLVGGLPAPLRTAHHVPLMEGRWGLG
jgi:SAM-dependent MidA family methyltransferase